MSGQGAIRTGRYEGGSVAEETRLAIENLFRILEVAGCSPSDVVRCGVYLTDMQASDLHSIMSEIPTLWLATTDYGQDVSFGRIVRIEA